MTEQQVEDRNARWKRIMQPRPLPRRDGATPDVHRIGGSWGNHLSWVGYKSGETTQQVYGHRQRRQWPVIGDHLHTPMENDWTAVWVFTAVAGEGDPPDMFFATVEYFSDLSDLAAVSSEETP
jgi:hypothetical protein